MKLDKDIKTHLIFSEAPIRKAVVKMLESPFDTVLEELDVELGKARIDVVLVGEQLHGVELKSDGDSLVRLPNQINRYNQVFDKVTLVIGYSHVYNVLAMIPKWWGIKVVEQNEEGRLCFTEIRKSDGNPKLNPRTLPNLLARWETLEILLEIGAAKGFRSRPSHILREHLVDSLELEQLKFYIRKALIARTSRRVGVL